MAFTVKSKKDGSATTLAHLFDLLSTAEGFLTPFVDNADANQLGPRLVRVSYLFKTGSVAPTANAPVLFFLMGADDESTRHVDAGLAYSSSSATEYNSGSSPTAAVAFFDMPAPVHVRPVATTTARSYKGSFVIDVAGMRQWGLFVYNNVGQALDTTPASHYLRYVAEVPDIR